MAGTSRLLHGRDLVSATVAVFVVSLMVGIVTYTAAAKGTASRLTSLSRENRRDNASEAAIFVLLWKCSLRQWQKS
jgi:hypothetical protein